MTAVGRPATAAARAGIPASKLVDWMMTFQFDGEVDYFELDPVAYAPALGEKGMASYRARLDELAGDLGLERTADPRCRLLAEHRPDELLEGRVEVFRRWPSSTTAAHLHRDAGETWPTHQDDVIARLATSPRGRRPVRAADAEGGFVRVAPRARVGTSRL